MRGVVEEVEEEGVACWKRAEEEEAEEAEDGVEGTKPEATKGCC